MNCPSLTITRIKNNGADLRVSLLCASAGLAKPSSAESRYDKPYKKKKKIARPINKSMNDRQEMGSSRGRHG